MELFERSVQRSRAGRSVVSTFGASSTTRRKPDSAAGEGRAARPATSSCVAARSRSPRSCSSRRLHRDAARGEPRVVVLGEQRDKRESPSAKLIFGISRTAVSRVDEQPVATKRWNRACAPSPARSSALSDTSSDVAERASSEGPGRPTVLRAASGYR